jgi:hypothetical protein
MTMDGIGGCLDVHYVDLGCICPFVDFPVDFFLNRDVVPLGFIGEIIMYQVAVAIGKLELESLDFHGLSPWLAWFDQVASVSVCTEPPVQAADFFLGCVFAVTDIVDVAVLVHNLPFLLLGHSMPP